MISLTLEISYSRFYSGHGADVKQSNSNPTAWQRLVIPREGLFAFLQINVSVQGTDFKIDTAAVDRTHDGFVRSSDNAAASCGNRDVKIAENYPVVGMQFDCRFQGLRQSHGDIAV